MLISTIDNHNVMIVVFPYSSLDSMHRLLLLQNNFIAVHKPVNLS